MQTPYPARRGYAWASGKDPLNISAALRIFQRMRSQHPQAKNPQRYATMTRMLEVLHHLNHDKDISAFPPQKLYKLFCAAADECRWYTDPTQYRKRRLPAPPGLLHCTGCDQLLPEDRFKAGHLSHLCAACRTARADRMAKEAREKAERRVLMRFPLLVGVEGVPLALLDTPEQAFVEGRRAHIPPIKGETVPLVVARTLTNVQSQALRRRKVALLTKHHKVDPQVSLDPDRQVHADVYPYYDSTLRILYRDTKQAINRHTSGDTPNEAKAEYNQTLLTAIRQAKDALDARLDEGTLGALTEGQVHWTRLLDDEQLEALVQARHELIAAVPRGTKLPELTTHKELQQMADNMARKWRAWQRHLTEQRKEDVITRKQKRQVLR